MLLLISKKEYKEFSDSELNFSFKEWEVSKTLTQISSNSDSEFKNKLTQIFLKNSEKNNKWKEK